MVDITTLSNPFPGLRSYEYEDHSLFFGRDSHIKELRQKLLNSRFLALIGSSGSGKSSLIKAGLIPSLEKSSDNKKEWIVIVFRPGANPIRSLVAALRTHLRKDDTFWESRDLHATEAWVQSDPNAMVELLSVVKDKNILLVIDQFEEIFRYELTEAAEQRQRDETPVFIDLLLHLINQKTLPIYAVITMRSDYLDHCTEFKGLTEAINLGYYLLPKMNQSEITQVITRPIQASNAEIAPDLVALLLQKIADSPDFLPILQHVLMRMWERWKSTTNASTPISLVEYQAVGAIEHSITLHAEEIYTRRLDEKRRNAAEKLFKTLIILGPSDTPSLHPASLRDIQKISGIPDYLLIDVVLVFRENGVSFLTPRPGVKLDSDSIIDVSVEKILALWDRSRLWIEQELESAKLYKQLSYSALQYQEGKTGLWINPELQLGLKWMKESEPTLEWAQRYDPFFERALNFLEYSKKQYNLEVQQKEDTQRRELRKARTFAAVLGVSSFISLLFLVVAMVLRTQAEQSERTALDKESLALKERKRAEDQTKEAVAQKKIAEQQGVIAEIQKTLTEEQKAIAVQEQENAVRESNAAKVARTLAEEQKAQAEIARGIAVKSQKETEIQKEVAITAKKEADLQKITAVRAQKEAETSRNDALRQRSKAISRFIAIQSYQMPASEELAVLLAVQGYDFNKKNGGERDNPEVFNALSKVAGAKATFNGHNDIVRVVLEPKNSENSAFLSAGDDGVINLWNLASPGARPVVMKDPKQTFKSIRSLLFSSDNKTLFVGTSNGQLVRWDNFPVNKVPTKTIIAHDGMVVSLLMKETEGKKKLISVSSVGQIRVWDVSDNRMDILQNVTLGTDISSAQASADGKYMFFGTGKGKLLRLDLDNVTKKPDEYIFNAVNGYISAIAFAPDGLQLFMGNTLGTIYSVDMLKDAPVLTSLSGIAGSHTAAISKIAFSPDGSRVATASFDWKIRIWNAQTDLSKQQPVTLNDFDSWVMDIRFTNDGKKLLASGADKTVRIWDINSAALYAEVSKKVSRDLTEEEWDKYIGKDIPYEKLSGSKR